MVRQRHGRTDGQTDRQTDGRLTIAIPRFALRASRGKNVLQHFCKCFILHVTTALSLDNAILKLKHNDLLHQSENVAPNRPPNSPDLNPAKYAV